MAGSNEASDSAATMSSGSGSAICGSCSRARNTSSRMVRVVTPSVARWTGVILPVCTMSASAPRRISTSKFAIWSRPRYMAGVPDTASSCPSLYSVAAHG